MFSNNFDFKKFFLIQLFCFNITGVLSAQPSRKWTDEDLIKLMPYWTFIGFSSSNFPGPGYYLIIPLSKPRKWVPFFHFMHEETGLKRSRIVP